MSERRCRSCGSGALRYRIEPDHPDDWLVLVCTWCRDVVGGVSIVEGGSGEAA